MTAATSTPGIHDEVIGEPVASDPEKATAGPRARPDCGRPTGRLRPVEAIPRLA